MTLSTLISAAALVKLVEQNAVRCIDCRFDLSDPEWGRSGYAEAHIPGAIYAHLDDDFSGEVIDGVTGRHPLPEPDDFAACLRNWGIRNGDKVVVYDQSHGGIAARAWWLMRWLGHDAVAVLDGGWTNWQQEGHPVTEIVKEYRASDYTVNLRPGMIADANTIEVWRQTPGYVVVDSRTPERYAGREEPIDPVAGHIPGAVNLPFVQNVDATGRWKRPLDLRKRFARIDTESDKVAFYCGSGVTASHNVLAFKLAGRGDARLYPGSWSEWITGKDRPVARKNE